MNADPFPSLVRLTAASALAVAILAGTAHGQDLAAQAVSDAGTVDRVVLYPRGAAVTRAIHRDLGQGIWILRVTDLPEGIDPRRIQAKLRTGDVPVEGGPKLLGVEYEEAPGIEFAGSPEGVELAAKLKEARRRLEHAAQDREQLRHRDARIDQVGVRAAANATSDGATAKSDPARSIEQLAWVNAEKAKVLAESRELADRTDAIGREIAALEATIAQRGVAGRTQRSALVRVAAPKACTVDLDLTYLVPDAAWAPTYAIRAAGDRSGTSIEYDAFLVQRSGEDWEDVRISLSTASPDRSAQPGEVEPVYVDVPPPATYGLAGGFGEGGRADFRKSRGKPGRPSGGGPGGAIGTAGGPDVAGAPADKDAGLELERLAEGANVAEAGIAATFELPRRVTVPSDASRRQRTRITTIEPTSAFVYAAQPLVTDAVFLRGDLVNESGYQLLPGSAQVYMGGDLIGDTQMPSVAPKSAFKVFFGPDRSVRAVREVVSKVTGVAGLFGGSVATTWKYRVRIDNGTGRDLRVELLDRRPVSRNEKIEVKVADLSAPLATDAEYAAGPQKSGILRWDLAVPASARGPAALAVTWTVQATHAKDVQTTALPD